MPITITSPGAPGQAIADVLNAFGTSKHARLERQDKLFEQNLAAETAAAQQQQFAMLQALRYEQQNQQAEQAEASRIHDAEQRELSRQGKAAEKDEAHRDRVAEALFEATSDPSFLSFDGDVDGLVSMVEMNARRQGMRPDDYLRSRFMQDKGFVHDYDPQQLDQIERLRGAARELNSNPVYQIPIAPGAPAAAQFGLQQISEQMRGIQPSWHRPEQLPMPKSFEEAISRGQAWEHKETGAIAMPDRNGAMREVIKPWKKEGTAAPAPVMKESDVDALYKIAHSQLEDTGVITITDDMVRDQMRRIVYRRRELVGLTIDETIDSLSPQESPGEAYELRDNGDGTHSGRRPGGEWELAGSVSGVPRRSSSGSTAKTPAVNHEYLKAADSAAQVLQEARAAIVGGTPFGQLNNADRVREAIDLLRQIEKADPELYAKLMKQYGG